MGAWNGCITNELPSASSHHLFPPSLDLSFFHSNRNSHLLHAEVYTLHAYQIHFAQPPPMSGFTSFGSDAAAELKSVVISRA